MKAFVLLLAVTLIPFTAFSNTPPVECMSAEAFHKGELKALFDDYLKTDNIADEVLYGAKKHYIVSPLGRRYITQIADGLFADTKQTVCLVGHLKNYILLLSSEHPAEFTYQYPKIIGLDAEVTLRFAQYRSQVAQQRNDYATGMAVKGALVGVAFSVVRYVPWRSKRIPFLERKFWNELGALSIQYATPGVLMGVVVGSVRGQIRWLCQISTAIQNF